MLTRGGGGGGGGVVDERTCLLSLGDGGRDEPGFLPHCGSGSGSGSGGGGGGVGCDDGEMLLGSSCSDSIRGSLGPVANTGESERVEGII